MAIKQNQPQPEVKRQLGRKQEKSTVKNILTFIHV